MSFDWPSTSPVPESIPNANKPNSTVAPFWRDLNPAGGSITYGLVTSENPNLFVVSWNDVRNRVNGVPQTFQVVIRGRQGWDSSKEHNRIFFQYQSITKDVATTVGIEDQVGGKGTFYDYNNLYNGLSIKFEYGPGGIPTQGYRLVQLAVKLTKSDSQARIDFLSNYIGGYNVRLRDYTNPHQDAFTSAIEFAGSLLIGVLFAPEYATEAGIIYGALLVVGHGASSVFSAELSPPTGDPVNANEYQNQASLEALSWDERYALTVKPFDSTLAATVEWSFIDPNEVGHFLTITAEAIYEDAFSGSAYPISTSTTLNMYVESGGHYGGCPFVSVWDGSGYVLDNNVLPRSLLSNGTDVEDYYKLEKTPVPREGKYSLLLSEFEREHSYFDQMKLLAVDHDMDFDIAVTPSGEILTYKNPAAPISAIDNYGNYRLDKIRLMDGNVSDPSTYFFGEPGDYLVLNFGRVDSDNAKLIFRDDYKKEYEVCIDVQVRDGNGVWQTVETLVPRAYWSMEAVNIASHITQGQDLWVRLYWKQPHRLDYVGLDTTVQADYEVRQANLASATHSTQGDVKPLLKENDNQYAELISGEHIQLEFTLPSNTKETRTYILYTKGRYTITP